MHANRFCLPLFNLSFANFSVDLMKNDCYSSIDAFTLKIEFHLQPREYYYCLCTSTIPLAPLMLFNSKFFFFFSFHWLHRLIVQRRTKRLAKHFNATVIFENENNWAAPICDSTYELAIFVFFLLLLFRSQRLLQTYKLLYFRWLHCVTKRKEMLSFNVNPNKERFAYGRNQL